MHLKSHTHTERVHADGERHLNGVFLLLLSCSSIAHEMNRRVQVRFSADYGDDYDDDGNERNINCDEFMFYHFLVFKYL